jgi:predicted dehydrogenase
MSGLRIALVGAGHLGRIHARLLASVPGAKLTAVVDPMIRAAEDVAAEHGARPLTDHRHLPDLADAAIVAAPTVLHHAVARELLRAGLHTFIEKPLAATAAEAQELVETAESLGRVLQVGHVERFNPAFQAAAPVLDRPQYIEVIRTSGYTGRSTDIGAVFDLMIHDIDLALALAGSEVERVEALGFSLLGKHEDMAQARLTFANGCVANLTASRTSFVLQRRMQVFASTAFASLDFSAPAAKIIRPSEKLLRGGIDVDRLSPVEKQSLRETLFAEHLHTEDLSLQPCNAILEELHEFAAAIRGDAKPQVDGRQALHAVQVAERVVSSLAEHRWNTTTGDHYGPFAESRAARREAA